MSILDQKQSEIDRNYDAFTKILPELIESHVGQFVVMRHEKPEAFFETTRDAMVYAVKTYEDGIFSVQEVAQKPVDLGWFSHASLPSSV